MLLRERYIAHKRDRHGTAVREASQSKCGSIHHVARGDDLASGNGKGPIYAYILCSNSQYDTRELVSMQQRNLMNGKVSGAEHAFKTLFRLESFGP